VDTLRVVLIAGVIVVHTATGYVADFAGFYYDDELVANTFVSIAFALPALLGGIFGLGPLFVVAGWVPSAAIAPSANRTAACVQALTRTFSRWVPSSVVTCHTASDPTPMVDAATTSDLLPGLARGLRCSSSCWS
jgi:peptidoglycan/LPS O-acetylase OafA/YrhL